jgi:hypothetical protein
VTAIFHVTLHCEHDGCLATFSNDGRYAQEARSVAVIDGGWTVKKGRAPNAWHDLCPEHGVAP